VDQSLDITVDQKFVVTWIRYSLTFGDEELTTNLGPDWVKFDYDVVAEKPKAEK